MRLTFSESQSAYLLVAEARKGDERQTLIESWKRTPATATTPTASVTIERKLLWEQADPILDVAIVTPSGLRRVLSPSTIIFEQRP